ncbi:hypothetical protein N7532_002407 [Penicillium argentinense]|uniref:Uncharacterized protein n=1 Tax=Penicillium argentinense TaxID=1131581 RepID=A0A9W9G1X0_9EURO|nr:uncharacterized protein N7532_002407 [Penicillium argentinense]KAJ5109762.1 hypothetical protein N7532_002407 [Penicillium argentinense]
MEPAGSQGATGYGTVSNHGVTLGNMAGVRHEIIGTQTVHMHPNVIPDGSLSSLIAGLCKLVYEGQNDDTASISSRMTTYDNDDKKVWREFRRELKELGFRSADIQRHSAALKEHLLKLKAEIENESTTQREEEFLTDAEPTPMDISLEETNPPQKSFNTNEGNDWEARFVKSEGFARQKRSADDEDLWSSAATRGAAYDSSRSKPARNAWQYSEREGRRPNITVNKPGDPQTTAKQYFRSSRPQPTRPDTRRPPHNQSSREFPRPGDRTDYNYTTTPYPYTYTPPDYQPTFYPPPPPPPLDPSSMPRPAFPKPWSPPGYDPRAEYHQGTQNFGYYPNPIQESFMHSNAFPNMSSNPNSFPNGPDNFGERTTSAFPDPQSHQWGQPPPPPSPKKDNRPRNREPGTSKSQKPTERHSRFSVWVGRLVEERLVDAHTPSTTNRADQKTKIIDLIPYGGLLPDEKLMEGKQVRVTLDEDLRRIESVRLCEENDKDHQNQGSRKAREALKSQNSHRPPRISSPPSKRMIGWSPHAGLLLDVDAKSLCAVPEGWDWRFENGRVFYIDTYAKSGEKRCFWLPPKEEDDSVWELPHWEKVSNIFGRISWVHRDSGLRSYRFPGTCKDFKYTVNGDLYIEQDGVKYRSSDWGFSRLQLNDLGVACQITHEVWNNGLSNEAAAVRGDLWWGNERVRQRHLKLSKNKRSRPLIAETNTAPEAAEPIDIEMDSDGTNPTAQDDEMQSGEPPQRLEEDDGSEDGANMSGDMDTPTGSLVSDAYTKADHPTHNGNLPSNYRKATVEDVPEEYASTAESDYNWNDF